MTTIISIILAIVMLLGGAFGLVQGYASGGNSSEMAGSAEPAECHTYGVVGGVIAMDDETVTVELVSSAQSGTITEKIENVGNINYLHRGGMVNVYFHDNNTIYDWSDDYYVNMNAYIPESERI